MVGWMILVAGVCFGADSLEKRVEALEARERVMQNRVREVITFQMRDAVIDRERVLVETEGDRVRLRRMEESAGVIQRSHLLAKALDVKKGEVEASLLQFRISSLTTKLSALEYLKAGDLTQFAELERQANEWTRREFQEQLQLVKEEEAFWLGRVTELRASGAESNASPIPWGRYHEVTVSLRKMQAMRAAIEDKIREQSHQ